MSASGLPGRRVEAIRAGIRTRTSDIGSAGGTARRSAIGLTGCQGRRKPAACAPPSVPAASACCVSAFSRSEPIDGSVRTQQGPWRGPRHLSFRPRPHIAAGAMFSAPSRPSWDTTLRCRSILRAAGMQPRRRRSRSRSCWRTPRRARRDRGQEMPGLPHVQQGEPNRVGPNLYGVVGRDRARYRGSTIRPR